MNLDDLQNVWNSPEHRTATAGRQRLAEQFVRQMIRRRRFQGLWLITTFTGLILATAVALGSVLAGRVRLSVEWSVIPVLLLPWVAAVHVLRGYLRPASAIPGSMPVLDAFQAALLSNQAERIQLRWVAVLILLMVPWLALATEQLHTAGKASAQELISMRMFFGAALSAGLGGVAIRYFGWLRPQHRRLKSLLEDALNGETGH